MSGQDEGYSYCCVHPEDKGNHHGHGEMPAEPGNDADDQTDDSPHNQVWEHFRANSRNKSLQQTINDIHLDGSFDGLNEDLLYILFRDFQHTRDQFQHLFA